MILSAIMAQQIAPAPATLATFANPNANCVLVDAGLRANYTGSGGIGASFSSAAILEPTYFEADLICGNTSVVAALQLYNGTITTAPNDVPMGQWFGQPGLSIALNPAWTLVYYGNYGLPSQIDPQLLIDLGFAESMGTVAQVAARPNGRIWIANGAGTWAGGGSPAADTTPSIVLPGTSPLRFGAGTSGAAAYNRLRNPSEFTPPSGLTGFRMGVAG